MKSKKTQLAPHRHHVSIVREQLDAVDRLLATGDVASAASAAYVAAKYAMDLSDDLRFEHGVKAGLARAASAKAET